MIYIPSLLRGLPVVAAALSIGTAIPATSVRAATNSEPAQALPSAAKLETDSYVSEIVAVGPYKPGATGTVRVTLTAKGIFHVNPQYPYRFKLGSPSEGVSYPKQVLERADGQFEEKKATFNLPFIANHAGKIEVGGVLHLSVCSPSSCIVQKTPLELSVAIQ